MNFQQLEYVKALHTYKHFGNAAESCHVTQATLSAMVRKLEDELGYVIFDRTKHPIKTTEKGIELLPIVDRILQQREEAYAIGRNTLTTLKGEVKLGVIPTVANNLLPRVLPTILMENPELKLSISEVTTDEIVQLLLNGQLDLAILVTPIESTQLEEKILYYEPMMVYGIEETEKQYITSNDIKGGKVWLLEEGHCFRNQSITVCDIKERQKGPQNLNFQGGAFHTLIKLADQFGGFTLVPELYYLEMPKQQQKRTKAFQKPVPVREVSLVSHRPFAKKQSMEILANSISELIQPLLSTYKFNSSDLEIIGI